jgi:hypothetical protein
MLTRLRFASAATLVACLIAIPAYSQDFSTPSPAPAPANLAFVDGAVDVVQSGVSEPADPPVMLLEGDVVRTRNGRAEIVFGDGTLLHLSHDSELEVLGDERLRLLNGRAIVRMSHAAARPYVIDTPASSVRLEAEGEYGITTERTGRLELAVARGAASLDGAQSWAIRGGQMLTVLGPGGRPLIETYNSARWDAFATWSYDRANGFANSASAAQLPYELRPYAPVLDHYGRWDYVAPHGYVWFPSVSVGWRPYYDGSWSFTRYGWTWHGHDRWAWPTHHYGRWDYNGAFWFWIPAKVWAPAWVTWSVGAGYVSWAPLGWHSRFDRWGRWDHPAYAPRYNPWRGWTVLPRHHFGPRRNVRVHAVDPDRLDDVTRSTLLSHAVPTRDDFAVPRDSADAPGARGNVRRPQPTLPASRVDRSATGNVRRDAPTRRDDAAYAPPPAWSGAVRRDGRQDDDARGASRARGRDARDRDPRVQSARPQRAQPQAAQPQDGRSQDSGATRGRAGAAGGAVRDPGSRQTPRSEPRAVPRSTPQTDRPSASRPSERGSAGGRAVPRSGASRRPGGPGA